MSDTTEADTPLSRAIGKDMTRRDRDARYDSLEDAIEREIVDPLTGNGHTVGEYDLDAIADEFLIFAPVSKEYHLDWETYPEIHQQTTRFWTLVEKHTAPTPPAASMESIQHAVRDLDFDPDVVARVAWSVMCEPGNRTAGRMIRQYGIERAFDMVNLGTFEDVPQQRGARPVTAEKVRHTLQATLRYDMTVLTPDHPHWPLRVDELLDTRPFALWARGDTALLDAGGGKITAIVGARAATGYGEHVTMELAADLASRGHVIVSGAAYGIDGMAHRATLAGHGKTVAVMAGGLDRPYPSGHQALYDRIVESGLALSELPPGRPPTKHRFTERNRLIAGLADVTVVPEAGYRSGSLNTAAHAFTLGRTVAAVPGPVTSAASAGTHRLLKLPGVRLVTTGAEVDAIDTQPDHGVPRRFEWMLTQELGAEVARNIYEAPSYPALARTLNTAAREYVDVASALRQALDGKPTPASPSNLHYYLSTGPLANVPGIDHPEGYPVPTKAPRRLAPSSVATAPTVPAPTVTM